MEELKAGDPENLGSYRVLGRLGAGGLSVVFLAQDSQGLRYAVKVLRPNLADEQRFRSRLAREADRIMSVAGRHTARVHDIVVDGPYVYIVMDHVDGETLERLVSNGRRIQGPLLWFMAGGIVDSIREIHAAGIVHRDLKPSNVLVGPDGIVVTDFGFGGILDEGGFARTGTLLGSVAWMSPEQITGGVVDARTDIFNLGLVLAYIALGHHPYATTVSASDSSGPLGAGRPEAMMYRISHSSPNIDAVPSPMREMIARCLSVDPTQRPSLPELGAFFVSGGADPITQPIPRIVQAPVPDLPRPVVSETDDTPPAIRRPEPLHAGEIHIQPSHEDDRYDAVRYDDASQYDTDQYDTDQYVTDRYDPNRDFTDRDMGDGPDHRTVRRRRTAIVAGALSVVGLVAAVGIVDATNVVDIGVIGAAETTTTTTSTTTSTTTTTSPPTTTLPPPPVYRLYRSEDVSYRWNPCQNPIRIVLNPSGKLTAGQQTALETFLRDQAAELSRLTGMTIEYAGLTEEKSGSGYAFGEEILIHIDVPGGEGLLQDDKPFEGSISGDRVKDGFREIDAVVFQYNANSLQYLFVDDQLHSYGQWLVMLMLGNAMGLDPLAESDMTAAGSTDRENWENEIMYFGGARTDTPTWGPGDIQGLSELGAAAGCF